MFEKAWQDTCRLYGECYDQDGQRVAVRVEVRHAEGRMTRAGYATGGEIQSATWTVVAENGRVLGEGERVSVRSNSAERINRGGRLDFAGQSFLDAACSAVSEWFPLGAVVPPKHQWDKVPSLYRNEWDCQAAWEAAWEAARAAKAAAKAAKQAAQEEQPQQWTLADLANLTRRKK